MALQLLLQPGAVLGACRAVLGPVGDDGPHRLVPSAEGALLQKVHKAQQFVGEAGFLGGGVEQFLAAACFLLPAQGQHHAGAGLVAPPEGHQHHAAHEHRPFQPGRQQVGIELVKVEGGPADCHLNGLQQSHVPPFLIYVC